MAYELVMRGDLEAYVEVHDSKGLRLRKSLINLISVSFSFFFIANLLMVIVASTGSDDVQTTQVARTIIRKTLRDGVIDMQR